MAYLMTIDAGTGSVRAVIFDEEGRQIAIGQREWTHLPEEGVTNSMGFDFRANWQLVITSIRQAIALAGINAATTRTALYRVQYRFNRVDITTLLYLLKGLFSLLGCELLDLCQKCPKLLGLHRFALQSFLILYMSIALFLYLMRIEPNILFSYALFDDFMHNYSIGGAK